MSIATWEPDSSSAPGIALHQTTSGTVAMMNLSAQIEGLAHGFSNGILPVPTAAAFIELVAQHGHLSGRIDALETALSFADALWAANTGDGNGWLARARCRARFHRFGEALADLANALALGAGSAEVNSERATILLALGHFGEAGEIFAAALTHRADFNTIGAMAVYHSECGNADLAEPLFARCRAAYRGVSPIPLAQLDFQRGHMWMRESDLARAQRWFRSAVTLLPGYAPAQCHLAEVEAELGKTEAAIARLLPFVQSSDDPDYAGTLARILLLAGRISEAGPWQERAGRGYLDLVARHPAAFADHAAFFWLEAGDPGRAHELASYNLALRQTPRAASLLARAAMAVGTERA